MQRHTYSKSVSGACRARCWEHLEVILQNSVAFQIQMQQSRSQNSVRRSSGVVIWRGLGLGGPTWGVNYNPSTNVYPSILASSYTCITADSRTEAAILRLSTFQRNRFLRLVATKKKSSQTFKQFQCCQNSIIGCSSAPGSCSCW